MSRTPILTLRLLDISMPGSPGTKALLLNGAKDLLKEHKVNETQHKEIDIELFHNQQVRYSGIQLSRYQGISEWTAIGEKEVATLECWFDLFKRTHPIPLENVVEIREQYTPQFIPYQRAYAISTLLVSDNLAEELNQIRDKFRRIDRLEKYLYGNLMTFFQHISFTFDKDFYFLKVSVLEVEPYNKSLKIFHEHKKTAFNVRFKCNFLLPQTLRLGQSTALGYGRVKHFSKY